MLIHISFSKFYRLRLYDGGYVFMSWHHFCGPAFYHDKDQRREIVEWWENPNINRALRWFQKRGNRA